MSIIESVQQYDLNIPAGGAQSIDVAGDRVQFLSAIDPFAQIEIRPNFAQGNISLKPGQGFKFSQQVQRWVVFNRGTVPLTGYLLIGSGDFFDQRIAGTVDVIDGGKARTLGNLAMMAYGAQPGVAAQAGRVQLWNPAGSAKSLCVESIVCNAGGAPTGVYGSISNVRLSLLVQSGISKLAGGAQSIAEVRRDAIAAGAPSTGTMLTASLQANASVAQKLTEPIVLKPGFGMLLWATAYQADIGATFEWYEDAA